MMIKKTIFVVSAASFLLATVCCLCSFSSVSKAQDGGSLESKEDAFNVPQGETRLFYERRIKELNDAIVRALGDGSDPRTADRDMILKCAEPMKAAVKGLSSTTVGGSLLESSSGDTPSYRVGSGLLALERALGVVDARDELDALERDVENWLEAELRGPEPRFDFVLGYRQILLAIETTRALSESEAQELGAIRTLRKLLDAELAKEKPDERRVRFFRETYEMELEREFDDNRSNLDEIFFAALRGEKASPRPEKARIKSLLERRGQRARELLVEKRDFDGANELAFEFVDASFDNPFPYVFKEVEASFAALTTIDPNRGDAKIVEAMERYFASDNSELVQEGSRLAFLRRFEGEKPVVEGVCVDGSVFDWNACRGKPTILVLCDAQCFNDPLFRGSYELLKQFADRDDANILTYTADDDLERWKPFGDATPWKTVSRKLTLDAQDRQYREFMTWRGFVSGNSSSFPADRRTPRFVAFDSEGVVVKNNGRDHEELETLLSEFYPNYFETAYRSVVELFDVPDDKDGAFYLERLRALGNAETSVFNLINSHKNPSFKEAFERLEQKRKDAVEQTLKKLAFLPEDDRSINNDSLFNEYARRAADRGDRAALDELLDFEAAKEKQIPTHIHNLKNLSFKLDVDDAKADPERAAAKLRSLRDFIRGQKPIEPPPELQAIPLEPQWENFVTRELLNADIQDGLRKNDERGMKEALDQCLADVADGVPLPGLVWTNLETALKLLKELDRPELVEYFRKAGIEKFKASDNPFAKYFVSDLQAVDRYNDLPGNELDFRASWFNPDDFKDNQPVDWDSFRGKPVLICHVHPSYLNNADACDAETSKRIDELKTVYQRFGKAGLEVIVYFQWGESNGARLIKEKEIPWRTARTHGITVPSFYKSFRDFYQLESPTTILVGRDGKVIDNDATGERLETELEKLFPDVD